MTLAGVTALCVGSVNVFATPAGTAAQPVGEASAPAAAGLPGQGPKAPIAIPAKPLDLRPTLRNGSAAPPVSMHAAVLALAADSTPPTAPTQLTAGAQSLGTLTAQWSAAQDPDSGIAYYIFGIGTIASGDYSTLANVKWWQVTYGTAVSVQLNLDPTKTYYVSVYAVNGAGVDGPIVTSNAVHPTWVTLGKSGNVMQLQFGSTGYDTAGNPTSGFTSAQIATMTTFFNRMYPILVQLYGPPAVSYTVTIVRDLRYTGTNEFIPSTDEIRMSDGFSPQLLTHELVHAFRNEFLLASDKNWNYDPTLSGFEEGFAQAVSYEAMNRYVQQYPNDTIVPGNTLWGSTYDWDYDFQNVPALRGTSFWSAGSGTLLYWTKYEMAAAAIRKIEIESPGFYAAFNRAYYARINASPGTVRPTQALIVSIIQSIVPTIEGVPAATWIAEQNIFYDQNVYGLKIFNQIQDYPWKQFFAFQKIYVLDTMSCGSEWACWNGQQWVYYDLNGAQGAGTLVDDQGNTVWKGSLQIQPTANPSDGTYAIGNAAKSLTTASTLQPWPGGNDGDYVENLTALGLYRFDTTFTDPNTGATVSNSVYRVLGSAIANDFKGVWGGVIGHPTGTISFTHDGYAQGTGIPVVNGAFAGATSWTGIPNARTHGYDSVPGKVSVTFVDGATGATYHAQRDVDYGSVDGSQMFLFDFGTAAGTVSADTTAPTVSFTGPPKGSLVSRGSTVTITANASDNRAVSKVEFSVNNVLKCATTTSPYSCGWAVPSRKGVKYTLMVKAYDTSGNTATASEAVTSK